MELVEKGKFALEKPHVATRFLRSGINEVLLLLKRGKIGAIVSYLISSSTGYSLYDRYLEWLSNRRSNPFMPVQARDFEMLVDLRDGGLSKELILYGTREEGPASVFRDEVERIASEVENPLVVELGANIGYYTILTANATRQSGEIVAIEPSSANIELLERNLEYSGIRELVTVHRCAISSETGTGTMKLARESNLHRLAADGAELPNSETVPLWRLDDFLLEHDYDPTAVSIVRMDIEGAEVDAIEGMNEVLAADGPTLLYIEIHNHLLERDDVDRLARRLSRAGFEIQAVEWGTITNEPFDLSFSVDRWDEVPDIDTAFGLIARK